MLGALKLDIVEIAENVGFMQILASSFAHGNEESEKSCVLIEIPCEGGFQLFLLENNL